MTTSRRVQTAQDAHDDLARLLTVTYIAGESRTMLGHALTRLQNARPALPSAQSFDGSGVRSSSKMSPVERNVFVEPKESGTDEEAARGPVWADDPSASDRVLVDTLLRRIRSDSDALLRLVGRWMPREASPKDRQLSAINEREEPECSHCRTVGKWSRSRQGAAQTTVNGNLDEPQALCAFCYAFTRDTGALPSRKQLEDHHNGIRVKRSA